MPKETETEKAVEAVEQLSLRLVRGGKRASDGGSDGAEPTKQREGDQPLPEINNYPFVSDELQDYLEGRKQVGIKRYGTPLQPHNGRDVLVDIFEELIDAATYFAQLLIERDGNLPEQKG